MAQRNGITAAQSVLQRQPSLSSFPPSRSPSSISIRNENTKSRSPQPPMVREDEDTPEWPNSHSRNSSLSAPQAAESPKNTRKVRSQYPADSPEKHVEYILVASFDIDRGSVMEHQYPAAISGDETMLAELMLPDQAHVRSQDWTIFFLHKDNSANDEEKEARRERRRRRKRIKEGLEEDTEVGAEHAMEEESEDPSDSDYDEFADASDEADIDGPPLVYVLNLVNTKQDNTVKRGAIVKAMAICTRHSFLHIYKPLLLLALEEYFRAPVVETLASLYEALNSMDLSLMPQLSPLERFILQSTDAKDMFIEKFEQMIRIRMAEDAERNSTESPRKPLTKYAPPRDTHEFESKVMYNGIPIPIKVPTALIPETVGDFSLIKLIQTFSTPHLTSPQPFALHPHLTTSGAYTHPIIVLMNALLTQKRIIFLGHNRPSNEVAEAVLAACALASGGLLRGFVRHAFPYTDLTKIDDLLKVPGFIAGVTNPAFSHKPEWWDLLCDLPTGRMKISNRIESAPVTDGLLFFQQQQGGPMNGATVGEGKSGPGDPTGDTQFMESLNQSIANHHGENAIRARWRSWILKFSRIASAFEETVYGASALYIGSQDTDAGSYGVSGHGFVWPDEASKMKELAANVHRVEGWRSTRSYYTFVQDLARRWTKRPLASIDLHHHHDRLRWLRLGHEQSAAIYLAFARAIQDAGGPNSTTSETPMERSLTQPLSPRSPFQQRRPSEQLQYDTILQLLTVIPESNSGLFYIALGLFHPKQEVRIAVVGLLERIMEHAAGRHFWATLGRFAKLAFFRVKREEMGAGA
ncbi:spindle pole body interacting protein [Delitschia confertaspora ATCC 74209]|uniref:Spindle pole body interacting protein n=1 Tax=Delitschia confertaspora ATCC 74209 TaxID=1513339 RepID=A0A9P4MVC2_9PLEO|nr:spindle pole body interacting protein [Delitschia confertaspora ATCC 74209]